MQKFVTVTIKNWDKHQSKSDRVRHPHWFKVKNDMMNNEALFDLPAEGCWLWVCLMSTASKKNSAQFKVRLDWLARSSKVKSSGEVLRLLEIMEHSELLTVDRQSSVSSLTLEEIREEKIREEEKREEKDFSVAVKITAPATHCVENFILNLSDEVRDRIQRVYPDADYVLREVEKMKIWLGANPKKRPKSASGWTRFVMGWLERGWERYRKAIPSNPSHGPSETNWNYVFGVGA